MITKFIKGHINGHGHGHDRGFTLIELLVVIAIIGILASVVLASLSTARDKGSDAAIQSSVSNLRAQAEIFGSKADGTVNYDGWCADATINSLESSIDAQNGSTYGAPECTQNTAAGTAASAWAFQAQLKTGQYVCVSSAGTSVVGAADVLTSATDVVCS